MTREIRNAHSELIKHSIAKPEEGIIYKISVDFGKGVTTGITSVLKQTVSDVYTGMSLALMPKCILGWFDTEIVVKSKHVCDDKTCVSNENYDTIFNTHDINVIEGMLGCKYKSFLCYNVRILQRGHRELRRLEEKLASSMYHAFVNQATSDPQLREACRIDFTDAPPWNTTVDLIKDSKSVSAAGAALAVGVTTIVRVRLHVAIIPTQHLNLYSMCLGDPDNPETRKQILQLIAADETIDRITRSKVTAENITAVTEQWDWFTILNQISEMGSSYAGGLLLNSKSDMATSGTMPLSIFKDHSQRHYTSMYQVKTAASIDLWKLSPTDLSDCIKNIAPCGEPTAEGILHVNLEHTQPTGVKDTVSKTSLAVQLAYSRDTIEASLVINMSGDSTGASYCGHIELVLNRADTGGCEGLIMCYDVAAGIWHAINKKLLRGIGLMDLDYILLQKAGGKMGDENKAVTTSIMSRHVALGSPEHIPHLEIWKDRSIALLEKSFAGRFGQMGFAVIGANALLDAVHERFDRVRRMSNAESKWLAKFSYKNHREDMRHYCRMEQTLTESEGNGVQLNLGNINYLPTGMNSKWVSSTNYIECTSIVQFVDALNVEIVVDINTSLCDGWDPRYWAKQKNTFCLNAANRSALKESLSIIGFLSGLNVALKEGDSWSLSAMPGKCKCWLEVRVVESSIELRHRTCGLDRYEKVTLPKYKPKEELGDKFELVKFGVKVVKNVVIPEKSRNATNRRGCGKGIECIGSMKPSSPVQAKSPISVIDALETVSVASSEQLDSAIIGVSKVVKRMVDSFKRPSPTVTVIEDRGIPIVRGPQDTGGSKSPDTSDRTVRSDNTQVSTLRVKAPKKAYDGISRPPIAREIKTAGIFVPYSNDLATEIKRLKGVATPSLAYLEEKLIGYYSDIRELDDFAIHELADGETREDNRTFLLQLLMARKNQNDGDLPSFNAPWVSGCHENSMPPPRYWRRLKGPNEKYKPIVDFGQLRKQIIDVHRYLGKLSRQDYHLLDRYGRRELPMRIDHNDKGRVWASRGAFKMQELHCSDPNFFNNCKNFIDPACGYGGFEQYLTWRYKNAAPRAIYYSTYLRPENASPATELMQEQESNMRAIAITPPRSSGDIRDHDLRAHLVGILSEPEREIDCLLLDISEVYGDPDKEVDWWYTPSKTSECSIAQAVREILWAMPEGSRALIKLQWGSSKTARLVHDLTSMFQTVRVRKLPTAQIFSREYYMFCEGKTSNEQPLSRAVLLSESVAECIEYDMRRAKALYATKGAYEKPPLKTSWFVPSSGNVSFKLLDNDGNADEAWPLGETIDLSYHTTHTCSVASHINNKVRSRCHNKCLYGQYDIVHRIQLSWRPEWTKRLHELRKYVRFVNQRSNKGRRVFFDFSTKSSDFANLCSVGCFKAKQRLGGTKHTTNAIVSSFMQSVCGISWLNSTFGHTQQDRASVEAASKKRLDVDAGSPSELTLKKLAKAMDLLQSSYGRAMDDELTYLSKDEVMLMTNYQGSTGILDPCGSLKEFMEEFPDWYELAIEMRVRPWEQGKSTGGNFSVRLKPEPKKRKDLQSDSARLDYDPKTVTTEQLAEGTNLTPRFIQFQDALSRIAHMIVLGRLIMEHNRVKLYNTSVSGLPPHIQGTMARCLWDMNEVETNKMVRCGDNDAISIHLQPNDMHFIKHGSYETTAQEKLCKFGSLNRVMAEKTHKRQVYAYSKSTCLPDLDLPATLVAVTSDAKEFQSMLQNAHRRDLIFIHTQSKDDDYTGLVRLSNEFSELGYNVTMLTYGGTGEQLLTLRKMISIINVFLGPKNKNVLDQRGRQLVDDALDQHRKHPAAIGLDFSALDTTITNAERMIAAHFWATKYKGPNAKNAVLHACREMSFAINCDDGGRMWIRKGQRGSGEILTSIENSYIVSANIACALAEALGLTLEEVLIPSSHVTIRKYHDNATDSSDRRFARAAPGSIRQECGMLATSIAGSTHEYESTLPVHSMPHNLKVNDAYKHYEITGVPYLVDGDDVVIFSDMLTCKRVEKYLNKKENFLTMTGKSIRSGDKSGCQLFEEFRQVEFCSHSYAAVFCGPGAAQHNAWTTRNGTDCAKTLQLAKEYGYRIFFFPVRPTAHCLSKIMMTLKTRTATWDPTDTKPGGCVDITQSKIISYTLLYPHIRWVRYACVIMLAAIGEGEATMHESKRKYAAFGSLTSIPRGDLTVVQSSLKSLYGVITLDDISLRSVAEDRDIKDLCYNARLLNKTCPSKRIDFVSKALRWLQGVGVKSEVPLTYDSYVFRTYLTSQGYTAEIETEDNILSAYVNKMVTTVNSVIKRYVDSIQHSES